ncbi:MAG: DUF6624 domain-containing protein [Bacteroidota bacterium]
MSIKRGLTGLLVLVFIHPIYSQGLDEIRERLEMLDEQNVALRESVMPTVTRYGFGSPEMDSLDARIHKFDSTALLVVTSIIDQYGWLGKSQIGETANGSLFTTVQHARDNAIRKKYFPLLKKSGKNGESSLATMASMKDRILIQRGKPQLYGTQYRMIDGDMQLFPIRNPDKLNERRKEVGLDEI